MAEPILHAFQGEKNHPMNDGSLLNLILGLVENLMLNATYDADALRQTVDQARAQIAEIETAYDAPAPEGAEAVCELMRESLSLYDGALANIAAFIDDEDDARLSTAVRDAEEATDVLTVVEELIQVSKNIISEMIEA